MKLVTKTILFAALALLYLLIITVRITVYQVDYRDFVIGQTKEAISIQNKDYLDIKSSNENLKLIIKEQEEKIVSLEHELEIVWDAFSNETPDFEIGKFKLTGYAPFDDPVGLCSDGNPNYTATGTRPTQGRTIAVDPNVIPLGSRVWVDTHGWRIAEDTGGLIKGNRIDIMWDKRSDALVNNREVLVVYFPKREE